MPTEKEWTIMVYMAGDNNLSEECVYALTEIKQGLDCEDKINILAQFDPSGLNVDTRRYKLKKSGTLQSNADKTWIRRETDTGEPNTLLEFIRWGVSSYPAKNNMLVISGHGSGTSDDFLLRDENPPDWLSIAELKYVFDEFASDQKGVDNPRNIDVFGMDTCLMSMAEVAYELKRSNVQYIVSSEGFAANGGWPYQTILAALCQQLGHGPVNPQAFSTLVVDKFKTFYVPYMAGGISVDQSVLVMANCDIMKSALSELAQALLDENLDYKSERQNALVLAHWDAQSYNGEEYVDLYDFCEMLDCRYQQFHISNSPVQKACKKVRDALQDGNPRFVLKSCYAGAAFQFSHGISIYFPWAHVATAYRNLALATETKWLDFLNKYVEKTRRPSRDGITKEDDTGRATPPTTKGRDGRVSSMRNPPIRQVVDCNEAVSSIAKGFSAMKRNRPDSKAAKAKSTKAKQRKK